MLKQRLITVAVLLPLLLGAMFLLPGVWWQFALVAPVLIAAHEWSKLAAFGRVNEAIFLTVLVTGIALLWIVASSASMNTKHGTVAARVIYCLSVTFWVAVAPCWLWLKLAVRNRLALAVAGIVVLLPTWLALAQLQHNAVLLLLLLCVVWIADTAA